MKHKSVEQLLEAIQQGRLNKVISLIKHGYNINVKNKLRQNLLFYILQQQRLQADSPLTRKRLQIFKYLVSQCNLDVHSFDTYGKNLFNWATNLNCTQEAHYLLSAYPGDIDILVRDQSGSCSLHYAVEHGNEPLVHAIVNYLLRYRLRFDVRDAFDNTPEDLARKMGYEKIGHFLAQACRSTIYLTREVPRRQVQVPIEISKTTATAKSTSKSVLSEYYNMIETRVHEAKSLDDWETVAALRAYRRDFSNKRSNRNADPLPQPSLRSSSIPSLPKIVSTDKIVHPNSQSEEMLRLFELHSSPSFRRQFVPLCQQTLLPVITIQRSPNGLHRNGHPSPSDPMQSGMGLRQTTPLVEQDEEGHLFVPPISKQHRKSIVATN